MRWILALPLALVACVEARDVADATARDLCGASAYAGVIGVPLNRPADPDARVIRPGDAVTMDFVAERLNLVLDEDGRLDRVFCG